MSATADAGTGVGGDDRPPAAEAIKEGLDRYATLVAFALMIAIFWALEPDTFGTWENFRSILEQAAPMMILAMGLTVVLAGGEFDLSFPGIIGLASVVAIKVMADDVAGTFVAVLAGLGVGLGAGIVAGLLVATERASSFVITLALGTVWSGLAIGISNGKTITEVTVGYTNISLNEFLGIPNPVYIALGVAIVAFLILRITVFGRQVRAIGSNPGAARIAGLRISMTRVGTYAVLGLCAGLTAVLLSSSAGQFSPDIGSGLFIPPYVAAFFGLSVLAAGRFNVFGTLVGGLFIATLQTGLIIVGAESWVSSVVVGLALIAILVVAARVRSAGRD